MKKRRLLSFLVLLMIAVTSAWAQEKVAYAVWDSDATTLTFKYDANKPTSNAWEINTGTTRPGWYSKRTSVTKVVFDASFADARPTSFYYWFYGCTNLTSIEGVTNLNASEVTNSDRMFYNCGSLASVTLPDGLTVIGTYAFNRCYSLSSVNIPESVTTVENNAFQNCSSLAEPLYNSKLFVFMPTSKEGTYDVPDGITTIAPYAFRNCYYLTKITIPESVTTVGNYAFQNCTGLTEPVYNSTLFASMPVNSTGSYTIPDGIKTVAPYAFNNCNSLINVIVPEGVTSIGEYAFYYCNSLTGVTLPASTESIGNYVFYGCNVLADVYVNAVTPPALEGYLAYDFTGKIYVPLESVEAYRSADNWRAYAGQIIDNLPRVNWATGANTENWTITVDGEVITAGETPVTAGKTVTVEYSGTRTVDLRAGVTLERQDNKWTFEMPELPVTLTPVIGVACIGETLYESLQEAINVAGMGSVVKLVYDAQFDAYNSYAYAYNDMILDLNGYAVNVFDGYGYLRVYGKLTVIDTSDDQKGGIKMKPEMYGGKLELMAGRYIYTADEINTNGYNGYGFVAENINTDASADADGYISKLRPMTAEEKSVAGYNKSKTAFKFTLEGIGSTEMSVIKNQEIRLTPPAGWKFGKILQGENEFWGGYWENNTYIINASSVNDYLGEIIANVIPDPNKLVDQLKGITLTQSDDKTSVSLKGAGGKTVVLYSENGATLMTQQVEIYKRATFKGLATGKIYYIGVDDMLVKVDTNL
jgi:surface protein